MNIVLKKTKYYTNSYTLITANWLLPCK